MSVRPKKALGQHFLADQNLLGVIGRLAELESSDVVLEVGPGLGVLTRFLAERTRCVHAIELDRSLEGPLREALEDADNVLLHFGDALAFDLAGLDPSPTKIVANLPYNIATPFVVESLERAPTVVRWCVMVQREIAERFFARPGTKAYGAVSVLVQLATEKVASRPVPATAFRPRPRVESALVAFVRVPAPRDVQRLVEAAFAHRRKTLANSVALAGLVTRGEAEAALEAIGKSLGVRAEELSPDKWVRLAEHLG